MLDAMKCYQLDLLDKKFNGHSWEYRDGKHILELGNSRFVGKKKEDCINYAIRERSIMIDVNNCDYDFNVEDTYEYPIEWPVEDEQYLEWVEELDKPF